MRKKLYDIYKKYKIAIIIALSILLIGILCLILFNILSSKSIALNEKNYNLKYDSSWKVKEKKDNYISLNHKSSKSLLKIEIITLDKEYKYTDIDDLIDEIIYNIDEQNKNYKLISKQKDTFTKYEFKGYKLLYETEVEQTMIMTFKKSDKLIVASYEAKNKYFDMLLDSVQNIVYNFNTADETFELKNSIKKESSKISYSKSEDLDKIITKNKEYEIAHNNYKVIYEVPSVFELSDFNTESNYFNLKDYDKGQMTISTYIYNKNVYEYLNKDNLVNVYQNYKMYKKDKDISDFKEQVSELDSKYSDSYIYKNSYKTNAIKHNDKLEAESYKRTDENIELIYSLNRNHILIVVIDSEGIPITKKLIDSIKIKSVANYSSYTKNKVENGYRIAELQKYIDYKKEKVNNIIIKLPEDYKEIDRTTNNLYSERYFGLNYDEKEELYDYVIHYKFSTTKDVAKNVELLNAKFKDSYGECNNYQQVGDVTINDKQFIEYVGGYTDLGGIPFTNINRYKYYVHYKALFYKLNDESYLIIEILGNGKEISDDIVNQATNFEAKEKNIN